MILVLKAEPSSLMSQVYVFVLLVSIVAVVLFGNSARSDLDSVQHCHFFPNDGVHTSPNVGIKSNPTFIFLPLHFMRIRPRMYLWFNDEQNCAVLGYGHPCMHIGSVSQDLLITFLH